MAARWEYELRALGGTKRVLMERLTYGDGEYRCWKDIAVFDSYNDAQHVLDLLNKALSLDGPAADG